MPTLSARYVKKPKQQRYCDDCYRLIIGPQVRLYGHADDGNPPYNLFFHLECLSQDTRDPKVRALLEQVKP